MDRLTDILRQAMPFIHKGIAAEDTVHDLLTKIEWAINFFEGSPITVEIPRQITK